MTSLGVESLPVVSVWVVTSGVVSRPDVPVGWRCVPGVYGVDGSVVGWFDVEWPGGVMRGGVPLGGVGCGAVPCGGVGCGGVVCGGVGSGRVVTGAGTGTVQGGRSRVTVVD